MTDLIAVGYFIVVCLTIRDVLDKLQGDTPKLLWSIGIVALGPVVIPLWYYTAYGAAREKRLARERRKR